MGDDKNVRHRFTVPAADSKVNDWIEAQSNLGFSIRTLIKAFIRDYGMQDATCLEFGESVKRMGRPPKKAQIHMGQMLNGTPYEEADADSEQVQDDDGTVQDGYYQNYGTSAAEAVPKAAETVKVPETDVYERQGSRNGREVHKELPPVRQTRSTARMRRLTA
jgi:hypothetical protein